jgi:acetyl-CoA synthetase
LKQELIAQNNGIFSKTASYEAIYAESLGNPDDFWRVAAPTLDWIRFPEKISQINFEPPVSIRWFEDGVLNLTANCIDRHLAAHGDRAAILWVGDTPGQSRRITYTELAAEVGRLANVLRRHGVGKGDTVTLYMPMIPEAAFAMLACARIGAVHSVVFGGFSAASLGERIRDCGSRLVITADEGVRGGKTIPLKRNVDEALADCPSVRTVLVARRTGGTVGWQDGRDLWLDAEMASAPPDCPAEAMGAEDPLFILYTSGSTGKPKGVLHTTGGYLVYAALTHRLAFDYQPGEVYWCTADVGWITGHSYVVYGPLANGATTLMFEGIPTWPDAGRCWDIVDEFGVSIFYTAPTAIRALMAEGDAVLNRTTRKSLRVLGSVGEPINPEVWRWYADKVGNGRCKVVDTWWQTETGGIMIAPLPGRVEAKPGSATRPFFGIRPELADGKGRTIEGPGEGALCIAASWPGQARTLYGDHDRFVATYFAPYPGRYFSGDGARRDAEGNYWITGRIDDVLNVSGHRIGTAEIESALVLHPNIAEAAVVGCPHPIKGEGIHAFVTPNRGVEAGEALKAELFALVRRQIGAIATPDVIQFAPGLPKTRSGKIMRRILRKIAAGDIEALGDTSTLADPAVVDELIANRPA